MMIENAKPLVVAFVNDLMFAVRIESAATAIGFRTQVVANAEAFEAAPDDGQRGRPGEILHGQGGGLFMQLAAWQPVLLIFDLASAEIPSIDWIGALKSSAATRRIPILCYGPHVDAEVLERAQAAGADQVVPRSRFASTMPKLIEGLAVRPDHVALEAACLEPLSSDAQAGIDAFNRGAYYDAHEELEAAWKADTGPGRDLYRSILQVAVAYYQVERGNYRGALKMLLRVRHWLAPLPDVCRGLDVARLREDVERVQGALTEHGPDGVQDLDRALFRSVRQV